MTGRRIRTPVVVRRPTLGVTCAGILAAATAATCGSLISPLTSRASAVVPARAARKKLTASQLAADLAAGAKTKAAPSNLRPPLVRARWARPLIVINGCHLNGLEIMSKPCVYGDTTSKTSVVLFGDSHAATWFPALDLISQQQHWRLVDLTKSGCPSAEVTITGVAGPVYNQCTVWRRNAMGQIAALHPALVVTVWSRFWEVPKAAPLAGVPQGYGGVWDNGVMASFKFLRRHAKHVLFISDNPSLHQSPPVCISAHLSDVRPCMTSRRDAVLYPGIKRQELALAKRAGIQSLDPTSMFCTPSVCPVIVDHIILYREQSHMTPQWSRFIAPVLADTVVPILEPNASASTSGSRRS